MAEGSPYPEDPNFDPSLPVPRELMTEGGPPDWTWEDEFAETLGRSNKTMWRQSPHGYIEDPETKTWTPNPDPSRTEGIVYPPKYKKNPKLVRWEREQRELRKRNREQFDPDPEGLQGRKPSYDPAVHGPLEPWDWVRLRVPPNRNDPAWHIEVGRVRKVNPDGTGYIKADTGIPRDRRINFKPEHVLDVLESNWGRNYKGYGQPPEGWQPRQGARRTAGEEDWEEVAVTDLRPQDMAIVGRTFGRVKSARPHPDNPRNHVIHFYGGGKPLVVGPGSTAMRSLTGHPPTRLGGLLDINDPANWDEPYWKTYSEEGPVDPSAPSQHPTQDLKDEMARKLHRYRGAAGMTDEEFEDKYGPTERGEYAGQALPRSTVDELERLDDMLAGAHGKVMTHGPCKSCGDDVDWVYDAPTGDNRCAACGAGTEAMVPGHDYPWLGGDIG